MSDLNLYVMTNGQVWLTLGRPDLGAKELTRLTGGTFLTFRRMWDASRAYREYGQDLIRYAPRDVHDLTPVVPESVINASEIVVVLVCNVAGASWSSWLGRVEEPVTRKKEVQE